ncbi:beta-lactamase/transpeptidase-like protein [Aspergillus ellipticus CBS 707.79]|uniref:Beta-lactamase/transpeptidase-like protein n=1 Tax=Aspergillus ellipticus CBS 707.79 TaxID=1448320 RepID=A0A319DUQ9_9EURO|nr:beta-lactamase/transpeptidase-like protein [Aspergillus ellipticus CBS 707.79]
MVLRSTASPLTPEFDDLVASLLEKWKVPGLTISIVHGSSTQAYGHSTLNPPTLMTPTTLFTTCSTTKAFTAAALSQSIAASQSTPTPISWTTPVSTLLRDDFVLHTPSATSSTTIEDILSHRTGLPGHFFCMAFASPSEDLRTAVRKLRHLPLSYPPRTRFNYCNHMFIAASHLLTHLHNGTDMGTILKNKIWSPLAMNDTYFDVSAVQNNPSLSPRLAKGYTLDASTAQLVPVPYLDYVATTGTGAMVSTVLDYAKWIRAMIYKSGPISEDGHAALRLPRTVISVADWEGMLGPPAGVGGFHLYALGWFVDVYAGEQIYWHSGSWEGFGIMVGFLPARGWGFAMMGNAQVAKVVQLELYLRLIDGLVGRGGSGDAEREAYVRKLGERLKGDMWMGAEVGVGDVVGKLFPGLGLERTLPHALGLEAYAGTYAHPGYGSLMLEVRDGKLVADLTDRVIKRCMRFEHVTGEFFVAKYYYPHAEEAEPMFFKVGFYVDAKGTVARLGMDVESALGEMVWFGRG